jgi:hypothetical protein
MTGIRKMTRMAKPVTVSWWKQDDGNQENDNMATPVMVLWQKQNHGNQENDKNGNTSHGVNTEAYWWESGRWQE